MRTQQDVKKKYCKLFILIFSFLLSWQPASAFISEERVREINADPMTQEKGKVFNAAYMSFAEFMDLMLDYEVLEHDLTGHFFNTLMSESDLKLNLEKARSELKKKVKVFEAHISSLRGMPQVNFNEVNIFFDNYIIILEEILTHYKAQIENYEQVQFTVLKYQEADFDMNKVAKIYAYRQVIKSKLAYIDVDLAELNTMLVAETSLQRYMLPLSISVSKAIARVADIEAISMIILMDIQSEFAEKDIKTSAKMGLKDLDNLHDHTVSYELHALRTKLRISRMKEQLTVYQLSLFEQYLTKSVEIGNGYKEIGTSLTKYFDGIIKDGLHFVDSDTAYEAYAEIELKQNYMEVAQAETTKIFY